MFSRFSSNSEADASKLLENLENYFLGATLTVMLLAGSNIQSHTGELPVTKR